MSDTALLESELMMNRYRHLANYFGVKGVVCTGASFSKTFNCNIKLPTGIDLILAIDGSTKQTGLAVFSKDMKLIGLFDFINDGLPNTNLFMSMMEAKLAEMLNGCKVVKMIVEKPISQSKSKETYGKLSEVLGMFKSLPYTIKALAGLKVETILAVSWRKYVFVKPEYKGRKQKKKDVKILAVLETEERFKFTKGYSTIAKPMDSCDACCIGVGYMIANYDSNGVRKVNKSMDVTYNHLFTYDIARYSSPEELIETWRYGFNTFGCIPMQFSKEMTIVENVRRVTGLTNKYVVLTVPKDITSVVVMWDKGLQLPANKSFIIVCKRNNPSSKLD